MIKQVTIIPEIKVEHHVSYFLDDTSKSMGTYLLYLNGKFHCTYTSLEDVEKAIDIYIKDELLNKVLNSEEHEIFDIRYLKGWLSSFGYANVDELVSSFKRYVERKQEEVQSNEIHDNN